MGDSERLVRDGVPERIRTRGDRPVTRTVEDEEFRDLAVERALAALVAYDERGELGDLADVLELVYALADHDDVDPAALEAARGERESRRGRFDAGVVLETVESTEPSGTGR